MTLFPFLTKKYVTTVQDDEHNQSQANEIRSTRLKKRNTAVKSIFKKKTKNSYELGIAAGSGLQLNGIVAVWKAWVVSRAP